MDLHDHKCGSFGPFWLKRISTLQALLVSERQSTVADEEKPNLKKDDANFPWGIGGTDYRLFEILITRESPDGWIRDRHQG